MSIVDDVVAGWIQRGICDTASQNQVGDFGKSEELHPHLADHLLLQQICLSGGLRRFRLAPFHSKYECQNEGRLFNEQNISCVMSELNINIKTYICYNNNNINNNDKFFASYCKICVVPWTTR